MDARLLAGSWRTRDVSIGNILRLLFGLKTTQDGCGVGSQTAPADEAVVDRLIAGRSPSVHHASVVRRG
jgi:hypothetical protein